MGFDKTDIDHEMYPNVFLTILNVIADAAAERKSWRLHCSRPEGQEGQRKVREDLARFDWIRL